ACAPGAARPTTPTDGPGSAERRVSRGRRAWSDLRRDDDLALHFPVAETAELGAFELERPGLVGRQRDLGRVVLVEHDLLRRELLAREAVLRVLALEGDLDRLADLELDVVRLKLVLLRDHRDLARLRGGRLVLRRERHQRRHERRRQKEQGKTGGARGA